MALLMTITAGPYGAAYNSIALGVSEDGVKLGLSFSKEKLRGDLYGDSIVDAVYRGGNATMSLVSMEYVSAGQVLNPYGQSSIDTWGIMGLVGRLDVGSGITTALVLTAVAGTTAAAEPATITASNAAIDADANAQIEFAARGRKVPLVFQLYPYFTSGGTSVPGWFTMT